MQEEKFNQNAVSRLVWPWQDQVLTADSKPSVAKVVGQFAVMLGIAAVLYFWLGHKRVGGVVSVLAVGVLASGISWTNYRHWPDVGIAGSFLLSLSRTGANDSCTFPA